MARIRSIKPEAFTSETLAGCAVAARWTFAGLWTYVDDDGRGRANAGLVKAAVWPLDEDVSPKQVGQILDELEACRLICRYEVDGKSYLHVVNFGEHQHPNRPVASKLPACSRRTHGGLSESALPPHPDPPAGGGGGVAENTEVRDAPKPSKTGGRDSETAGQGALTEGSLHTHGARTPKPSSTPPTPVVKQGEGVGDVGGDGVPPTAGAAKPRRANPESAPGNAGEVVAAYVDGAKSAGLETPGASLRNRVGKQARELLREGKPLDKLITAAQHMGVVGWDDLARQVQRDAAANANGSSSPSGHKPYRNPADQSVYDEEMRPS